MKFRFIHLLCALFCLSANAAVPANYYSSCEYKGGQALLTALCAKVGPHTVVSYDDLFDLYKTSDVYPDGKIWDMYSTKHWAVGTKCGNYSSVGDCYNREHSFPKSWFNDAKPMYSDAFHLYPTDGKVNGQRSNFPYGECANGTTLASANGVDALGKLGNSTFSGYSGTVFEPVDEYKGDFARSYFYMAAAYNDKISSWSSPMLAGNSYPCFSSWSIQLLLKWHRQDPVSEKELNRNEAVYARQNNRNPFIDHPEMVEFIWGNRKSEQWSSSGNVSPELTVPANGSTFDFGIISTSLSGNVSLEVAGANLTKDVSVSLSGAFSSSVSVIPYSQVVGGKRFSLPLTIKSSVAGVVNGTLVLKSGDVTSTVYLKATAVEGLPVNDARNVSDRGFTASWINVGDADAQGCYQLYVESSDGKVVAGYPVSVIAADQQYVVDDLQASTAYVYYVKSQKMTSAKKQFTTKAPIPSIDFFHDGPLNFVAAVNEPSAEAEIEMAVENIAGAIQLDVKAPFQLSLDHSSWSTQLSMPQGADRFYVRMLGSEEGEYTSSLVARAGDYQNDDAELHGVIGAVGDFTEDFEVPAPGSYSATTYQGKTILWNLVDAGCWSGDPVNGGASALRLGKNVKGLIEMAEDLKYGLGSVSFYVRKWTNDVESEVAIEYSVDGGENWEEAGKFDVVDAEYKKIECVINKAGNVRMRLRQLSGKRWLLDDLSGTGYSASSLQPDTEYNSWDVWPTSEGVCVRLSNESRICVYGVDGVVYLQNTFASGVHNVLLAPGFYIVSGPSGVRRVVVE